MKRIFFPFALLMCTGLMAQEGTVGIGTQTPNRKAVLHLVARSNNQGFLVPKLTTSQRSSFGTQLNSSDNGMMVYDSDLDQFFYWITNKWEAVGETLNAGDGIEISGSTIINTGDTDASDDFSGEWDDLANMPSGFQDGTDDVVDADNDPTNEIELPVSALTNQILIYNGTSWGAGFLPSDGDTDATNEIQDLQLISNILSITGKSGATQINLAPYVGTNTDEQDLKFESSIISLTGDPDNTQIDLSSYDADVSDDFSGDWVDLANIPAGFLDGTDDVDDADASITNEIQDLSLSGDNLTITGNGSPTTIDLSPYLDNTDLLTTLSGTNGQVLTYDGSDWGAASLPTDGDADDTNEIQDLSLSGDNLTITGNVSPTTIDLSPYLDNTDLLASISGTNSQVLTYSGGSWLADDIPADGDGDATNEIQDLQLAGNILTITGNASPTAIDLSPYSGTNTDEQDLAFSGGVISLAGDPDNTQIDLAPYLDNTDLLSTLSGTSGQVLTYDGADWGAADLPTDGDSDDTNELQDLSIASDILTITGLGTPTDIDLSPYINTDLLASISGTNGQVLTYNGTDWVAGSVPSDGDSDDTNELQDLSIASDILTITGLGTPTDIDLSPYINTDLLASISGTNGQVLTHNGTDWVAGSVPSDGDSDDTNELQDLSIASDILTITGLGTPTDIDLSPYINTDLLASLTGTNGQVLTYDGSNWSAANLPADGDTDDANELQDLDLTGNTLTITGLATPTDIDLAPYLDNTDLLASISGTNGQVLTHDGSNWSAANLPADGDTDDANEIQDLSLTGDNLTITVNASPTSIDLSPYKDSPLTEGSDAIGSYVSYSGHIKALNVINTVSSITHSNLSGSQLPISAHQHAKTIMLDVSGAAGSTDTITEIEAGLNGQEMMIVCTGGTLVFDNSQMNGSNLVLPTATVSLPAGGSIKLMYVSTLGNWIHIESVTTVVNPN